MKILHTSDWHFGIRAGALSLAEDQRHFLKQMAELIRKEKVEAVLLCGDVYDSSVVNADAIGLYNEAMTLLCMELGVQVITIAGNHDSAARLASCRRLLRGAGLHVTGRLERDVEPVLLDGGKVAVYSLPFFGREEVTALFPEKKEEIRSQETAMLAVCDHIRETMDKNRFNIVVSHALIVNAEISESDRSARVGFATAVSKDVFREFDYVALGHIHKPQVIDDRIRYSGSPLPYSFGSEETQQKGVVLIDTQTGEQTFQELAPLRRRLTLEGTYEELIAREDCREDYLRLRMTDKYAGLETVANLRERFPRLLEVYGKSIGENETLSALSVEELQSLDETDIMEKFLAENFGYEPTQAQYALFKSVLAWSREEDDLG